MKQKHASIKERLSNGFEKVKAFYRRHPKPVMIGGGALGLVIIVMIVLSLTVFKKDTSTTQTVTLTRGNITQSIEVVGAVRAVPSATLTWATSGIVMPFSAKVGDMVKAGDTILELEPSSVSSDILQAQSDLITAKNNLTLLETADTNYQTASQTLADAEAAYENALVDLNSINENNVPIATLEPIIDAYFAARETYWEAQAAYEATGSLGDTAQQRVTAKTAMESAEQAKLDAFHKVTNSMGIYFGNTQEDTYIAYRAAKASLDEARVLRDSEDEDMRALAEAELQFAEG